MSHLADLTEIAVDLSNKMHKCLVMIDNEYNKLGMKTPRCFRRAVQDLRFAHLRARDELRYLAGDLEDDVKADPNGEVQFEISQGR